MRLLRQGLRFTELPARRQTVEGNTSARIRSLAETVRVLLCLLVDVHIRHRDRYSKRPVRVP